MDLSNLGIANLVLLVVPGFISNRVYRSAFPAKSESEWTLAGSVLISTIWVLILIRSCESVFCLSILEITDGKMPSVKTLFALLAAGYSWGYLRVAWHHLKFKSAKKYKRLDFLMPDLGSIWAKLNNMTSNEWVKVIMTDGSIYLGWVSDWSRDPDQENFDFLLKDAKRVDQNLNTIYEIDGSGLYIKSTSVLYLEYWG